MPKKEKKETLAIRKVVKALSYNIDDLIYMLICEFKSFLYDCYHFVTWAKP